MKTIQLLILTLAMNAAALADNALAPVKDSTHATVLQAQSGKLVELRLKSGEKLGGKVTFVGDHVVHLTAITGQEMFEATVSLDAISAVLVRTNAK